MEALERLELAGATWSPRAVMPCGAENCPGISVRSVAPLSPGVAQARRMGGGGGGDVAEQAIKVNVQTVAEQLRSSEPVLSRLVRAAD